MIPFLIPWGGFDIVFVPFSEFVQVADKVGGYGIMFIVVAVNAVFVYFVKQASATRRFLHVQTYLPLVIISFLLFVPVIYGKFQLQKYESEIEQQMHAGHFVNSVLVQGNYSTKER